MPAQLAQAKINDIDTDALKATMQAVSQNPATGLVGFQVTTHWKGGTKSETRVEGWELAGRRLAKDFTIEIDEPHELLGENTAPNPQEYLLAAVNACIMATFVAACSMQGIRLDDLQIETRGQLDLRGFLGLDKSVKPGYDELEYTIRVRGNGTQRQFETVHNWVMATSPNYWNMANAIRMKPRLIVD